jgi:hypothetical protein
VYSLWISIDSANGFPFQPVHFLFGITPGLAFGIKEQLLTRLADPTDTPGRVTRYHGVCRHIPDNYRTCTHQRVGADFHATDDGGISPDRTSFSQESRPEFVLAFNEAPGVGHVGEDHGRTEENIIFHPYTVVQGNVVLDFYAMADIDIIVDEHILAKLASAPDYGTWHDVTEMPDFGAGSYARTVVHHAGRVNKEVIFHGFWISWF